MEEDMETFITLSGSQYAMIEDAIRETVNEEWKSKVKEKIEELRKEKYDDITFKYNKIEVNGIIEVILQELLED